MAKKILTLLDDFGITLDAPTEPNVKMKEGLARMYADPGIRSYLEYVVKYANRNLIRSLDSGNDIEAKKLANRIETVILLLTRGKDQFTHFEDLKKKLTIAK